MSRRKKNDLDEIVEAAETILLHRESRFDRLIEVSGLNPRYDFIAMDLRGADFRDADLRHFNFSLCDLRNTNLNAAREKPVGLETAFLDDSYDDTEIARFRMLTENYHRQRTAAARLTNFLESLHSERSVPLVQRLAEALKSTSSTQMEFHTLNLVVRMIAENPKVTKGLLLQFAAQEMIRASYPMRRVHTAVELAKLSHIPAIRSFLLTHAGRLRNSSGAKAIVNAVTEHRES